MEISTICDIREKTISCHFNAAFEQLKSMVEKEPLQTIFKVTEGCVSKEVTDELAFRLSKDKYIATARSTGFYFLTTYYLEVNMPLPEKLIHKQLESSDI
jgi:hypothetical protein